MFCKDCKNSKKLEGNFVKCHRDGNVRFCYSMCAYGKKKTVKLTTYYTVPEEFEPGNCSMCPSNLKDICTHNSNDCPLEVEDDKK